VLSGVALFVACGTSNSDDKNNDSTGGKSTSNTGGKSTSNTGGKSTSNTGGTFGTGGSAQQGGKVQSGGASQSGGKSSAGGTGGSGSVAMGGEGGLGGSAGQGAQGGEGGEAGTGGESGHGAGPCVSMRLKEEGKTVALPALVSLNFQVTDCVGKPIADLACVDFIVEEDGEDISQFEATAKTVTTNLAYNTETMLLLDLSGSVVSSGNLDDVKAAAIAFVNSVLGPVPADNHGNIAVYSFDGDAAIHEISPFSSDRTSLTNAITGIACPGPYCEDSTTNLYGAVMRGIAALDQRILTVSPTRANIGGMFIVFTDGTDRAQRQTEAEALAAVMRTPSSVITVGAGAEIDKGVLGKLGRDGYYEAKSYKELSDAFVEVAGQVRDSAASHYTLYFCSDRRNAADHSLTIKVKPAGAGELSTKFNSAGFKGGCMLPMAAAMCK
jgi:hypothetical protein